MANQGGGYAKAGEVVISTRRWRGRTFSRSSPTLKNKISSVELYSRLDVEAVADVVRRGRLRWFGHLERKSPDDWVSACRDMEVYGVKRKGRSRKTWGECVS